MFDFPLPITSSDLMALGGLFFLMVVGRFLKDETRIATYGLIAAVLTGNPMTLYIVPLLAMTIKMVRFN